MKIEVYSHHNGENIVSKEIKDSLLNIIINTQFTIREGCSIELKKVILTQLKNIGWSNDFNLDVNSQISLTSYIDNHILCFQTGNMGRFYADLLKMQYVFQKEKARVAIYIIPSKTASKIMGSNVANFERFTNELQLFREIITVPILVLGIN
jgi:hypothetical protein